MTELFTPTPGRLSVDVWSDVVCPFCYMGDTLLEQALADFEHADKVDITYHSFQLMPELVSTAPLPIDEVLSKTKGISPAQARAMNEQVATRGRELGLDYRFDLAQTATTKPAHQLSHLAAESGKQHEVMQELFRAYFTEGKNVADTEVLLGIGEKSGMDPDQTREALAQERFLPAVEADLLYARQLGVSGVPFFVFGGKYALNGAQPVEAFAQALRTAWQETVTD
ncbi:DsbA family oxidoreductase [Parenemella sanctibonifatiensis]|uniref:Protein-disulfide isomerase n=1 Tax=Parenemella sanctibonifatiensis TaxID=2016505 RepID=A0A255EAS3_9ACTN|nr:DsbA family oxidoreductase [Parenemella sanctibonifatiensis]OYN85243.1 protein-disulfide isomerase [Parenemella sanctibonifatiensis]